MMNPSRILVVEDDSALSQALSDTLVLSGYEVIQATDGEQALARLDRDTVDMVLTDVQMRPMDGRALLRNLRSRFHDLPVLIMTAYGTVEQAVEAIKLGAVDYLAKPFNKTELLVRIDKLIELNKTFTFMMYPDRSHSIDEKENTKRHMFTLMTEFLHEHLPLETAAQ